MKTLLALVPAAMTLTGCLCGAYEGQDDQVLRTPTATRCSCAATAASP